MTLTYIPNELVIKSNQYLVLVSILRLVLYFITLVTRKVNVLALIANYLHNKNKISNNSSGMAFIDLARACDILYFLHRLDIVKIKQHIIVKQLTLYGTILKNHIWVSFFFEKKYFN